MKKTIIIGLIIVVVSVLIDQLTKAIALTLLQPIAGNTITLIEGFLRLKLTFNTGAGFSLFDGEFTFLMIMTVIATIVFIIMARWSDFKTKPFYSWGVFLMIGGMIGNFIDRVFNNGQGVIDFISVHYYDKWAFAIFNIADSFLVVGVICIIIDLLFFEGKREKKQIKNRLSK